MSERIIHIDCTPSFEPGDQPPQGYTAWHAWAEVQHKAGLRQSICSQCCKWRFPQEVCCGASRQSKAVFERECRRIAKSVRAQYPTAEDAYKAEMKARGET